MSCLHSERERERKREFQTEGTFIYASALPQGGVQQLWKNGRKETVHLYMLRKKTETEEENTRNRITEHIHEHVQQRN